MTDGDTVVGTKPLGLGLVKTDDDTVVGTKLQGLMTDGDTVVGTKPLGLGLVRADDDTVAGTKPLGLGLVRTDGDTVVGTKPLGLGLVRTDGDSVVGSKPWSGPTKFGPIDPAFGSLLIWIASATQEPMHWLMLPMNAVGIAGAGRRVGVKDECTAAETSASVVRERMPMEKENIVRRRELGHLQVDLSTWIERQIFVAGVNILCFMHSIKTINYDFRAESQLILQTMQILARSDSHCAARKTVLKYRLYYSIMNVTEDLILIPYFILSDGTKLNAMDKLEPYEYRSMWEIVKSCVLTIFACTWATMHPNIPSGLRYKAHLWLVDLIMPELLLLWAAKQYFAACSLIKSKACRGTEDLNTGVRVEEEEPTPSLLSFSTTGGKEEKDNSDRTTTQALLALLVRFFGTTRDKGPKDTSHWTTTQAFFALMGGSQDEAGHILSPYASRDRIKMPTEEEILDKSKADLFVKLLALVQTVGFALDTIYRIQSSVLYATEAEIVTFTFACLSAITKFFWWSKPQDLSLPLPHYPNPSPSQNPQAFTDDAIPPNFLKLAISMLHSDSGNTHAEFISKADIYAYNGELSWGEMTIAVLFAAFFGSLSGICHLIAASSGSGLATSRGRIWFSFALVGSALPFYLLLVVPISFVVKVGGGTEKGKAFLHQALNTPFGQVFLITSMIGRIALIVSLISFMFFPYAYTAFLIPVWSQYIPF